MNNESPETQVGKFLKELGFLLAVAESCTGGLISHCITNIPGSSTYFIGGVTVYSNEAKMKLLGVDRNTLDKYGAVSQQTVLEMARGVRQLLQADIGLSISGIAGPDGGSPEKPVGLTWIALSAEGYEHAWSYIWQGDRLQVKEQSANQALMLVLEFLKSIQSRV